MFTRRSNGYELTVTKVDNELKLNIEYNNKNYAANVELEKWDKFKNKNININRQENKFVVTLSTHIYELGKVLTSEDQYEINNNAIHKITELGQDLIDLLPVPFWQKFFENHHLPCPTLKASNYKFEFKIQNVMNLLEKSNPAITISNVIIKDILPTFKTITLKNNFGTFPIPAELIVNHCNRDKHDLIICKNGIRFHSFIIDMTREELYDFLCTQSGINLHY